VSKLVAYREKDFAFAAAMMEHGLIDPLVVAGRIDLLPTSLDLPGEGEVALMVERLG